MDSLIPLIVFTIFVVSVVNNVMKKIKEIKGEQGPEEESTVARQLRELLQDDEDKPASQVAPPPRPSVKPLEQPVARTQPPRPSAPLPAAPQSRPVAQAEPVRPAAPPTVTPPPVTPRPVRSPAPEPLARQARMETPAPAPQTVRPRPVQARPLMEPVRPAPAASAQTASVLSGAVPMPAPAPVTQVSVGIPYQRNRGLGRCPRIHLNRKNLGAALVITEIMNPPLALREQNMPWDM